MTSINNELFVVRSPCREHIEVYAASTFKLQRHLLVVGLSDVIKGLASCTTHNCLYVSDSWKNAIHRIELKTDVYKILCWKVAKRPMGLSVNKFQNVIVTFWSKPFKIHEYTTGGQLVRSIRLQTDMNWPSHAIQLVSGNFVVSHGFGDSLHRVCLVDNAGHTVTSLGRKAGTANGQFNAPRHMTIDAQCRIVVADCENNRLVTIDPSLNRSRDLLVTVDGGLYGPYTVHLDESRNRLYVGEWMGGRVHTIEAIDELMASPT